MRARRKGQASAEYAIVVALVAILLVASVAKLAGSLRGSYQAAAGAVEERVRGPLVVWDGPGPNPFRPTDPARINRRNPTDPAPQGAR